MQIHHSRSVYHHRGRSGTLNWTASIELRRNCNGSLEPQLSQMGQRFCTRTWQDQAHISRHPPSRQSELANEPVTQMLRASTAARVSNEMHARCRYLHFSSQRDLQSHTDIQASRSRFSTPRDRESGHEGRGDTLSARVLLRRRPFVETG